MKRFRFILNYEDIIPEAMSLQLEFPDRIFRIVVSVRDAHFVGRIYDEAWGNLYTCARQEGYLP